MHRRTRLTALAAVLFLVAFTALPAAAQYFGRNKVQYDNFDFKILRTDHFDIYFYPEEEEAVKDAARMAERWYRRHSRTFLRDFDKRRAVILYANDADFQQTNVIGGFIGEGTGGVTEGLKQRVVMPLTGAYGSTDHVLGHELVHSFQYDIAFSAADSARFNLGLLPLWLVEGTAEYLSVGRVDPHTAMWLRNAVLQDDLPTMDQLTRDQRYFPYRYGQAYMAYLGGKYGDASLAALYRLAGRIGIDSAFVYTYGITSDSLSHEWADVVRTTYTPLMEGRTHPDSVGRIVLSDEIDAGKMNISPAVSPDGKYVAFLSERDVISINLFIADAETGKVIKKLVDMNSDAHFDALRFINTAGTWSPDGRKFAFVTFAQGENELTIYDVETEQVDRRIMVRDVGAMSNPAWSPDGKTIAFAGIQGGISDLYLLDVDTREVRQLTDDQFADMQPAWSPDGRMIAFTTDRGPGGTDFKNLEYSEMRLALFDLSANQIQVLRPFGPAQHHNPQFSPDGRSLYFISDQDGFKDIYRMVLNTGELFRVTYLKTGVSGITDLSPAMTVAAQSGRMMFSVFSNQSDYNVHSLAVSETVGTPVRPESEGVATAGTLPPLRAVSAGLVGGYLNDPLTGLPPASVEYEIRRYSPRLKLDYVAPPSVGVSVGGPFGTRAGGGVGFFFSDMLGNQNLTLVAQANGTFKDIGAQASYLNQGNRLNWGFGGGHIPVLYGRGGYVTDPETNQFSYFNLYQRIFIDQLSGIAQYPLSQTRRLESSLGFMRYGFDYEMELYGLSNYYTTRNRIKREDLDENNPAHQQLLAILTEPDPIYFATASLGLVGDYSRMGFTSPIAGGRYRFQVAPLVGTNSFLSVTADYRRYLYARPFTFAFRGLHVGNYGADESNRDAVFWQEYLGYSYYQGFIRGYNLNNFSQSECTRVEEGDGVSSCAEADRLFGSRLAMGSAEFRIPLLGIEGVSLINFPYLPTDLALFADAGVAWTASDPPVLKFKRNSTERIPVTSVGVSARVNLLGYLILETYYAFPFQRPGQGWHFGFQLMPGW